MEPENHLFLKGKSSSTTGFLASMLIFRGVMIVAIGGCDTKKTHDLYDLKMVHD